MNPDAVAAIFRRNMTTRVTEAEAEAAAPPSPPAAHATDDRSLSTSVAAGGRGWPLLTQRFEDPQGATGTSQQVRQSAGAATRSAHASSRATRSASSASFVGLRRRRPGAAR